MKYSYVPRQWGRINHTIFNGGLYRSGGLCELKRGIIGSPSIGSIGWLN
jgi:hypothetical protein